MQRSKNVQKIEYALDELGFVVTSIVWEPWGKAMEMQGIEGGWRVEFDDPVDCHQEDYDAMGLSIDELLDNIYNIGTKRCEWCDFNESGWFYDKFSDDIRLGRPVKER